MGMIAALLSWNVKDLLAMHRMQSSVKSFLSTFREMQVLAMSHQTSFTVQFDRDKDQKCWRYRCTTDEPVAFPVKNRSIALSSVSGLLFDKKEVSSLVVTVLPSGAFYPQGVLQIKGEKSLYWIDLREPPQVKLCDQEPL